LTKAFDTVSHHLLITKLEHYGIVGKFGNLLRSYLSNRYQRVLIKSSYCLNQVSIWEQVKHGSISGLSSWTFTVLALHK
jgi:hypothetical protein